MAVFPEDMNRIDPQVPSEALRVIENYIRYMGERIEFSFSQMTKNVTEAGVSSVEIYIQLQALQHAMSAMQSDVNGLLGRMNSAEGTIGSLTTRVSASEGNITGLTTRMGTAETNISGLTTRLGSAESNITSLTTRVGSAEGSITSLTSRVGTNEGDISSMQSYITNHIDTALSSLDARVTALEGQTTP